MKFPATSPAPSPKWMRIPVKFNIPNEFQNPSLFENVSQTLKNQKLYTVCEEASCPNLNHCWSSGTATFLIMGNICTRRCGFCDIQTGKPRPLDESEPMRVAMSVKQMNLKHVVITSVDRDELKDCGSEHFSKVIQKVREWNPETSIEVLIPDFKGKIENLEKIWSAKPDILSHNIETVPSLYKTICPQSHYEISLGVLKESVHRGFLTKTGIMIGLGESMYEIFQTLKEIKNTGTHMLTIGQYLQPSSQHAPLKRYYSEEEFQMIKEYALSLNFLHIEVGPLVRSSYHAGEGIEKILKFFYKK